MIENIARGRYSSVAQQLEALTGRGYVFGWPIGTESGSEDLPDEWISFMRKFYEAYEVATTSLSDVIEGRGITEGLLVSLRLQSLEEENALLKTLLGEKIAELEARVAKIEEAQPEEKIIVLREMPREEAKQAIMEMFSEDRVLYFSDIAEELRLELPLVVELCQELMQEGKIEVSGESQRSL